MLQPNNEKGKGTPLPIVSIESQNESQHCYARPLELLKSYQKFSTREGLSPAWKTDGTKASSPRWSCILIAIESLASLPSETVAFQNWSDLTVPNDPESTVHKVRLTATKCRRTKKIWSNLRICFSYFSTLFCEFQTSRILLLNKKRRFFEPRNLVPSWKRYVVHVQVFGREDLLERDVDTS